MQVTSTVIGYPYIGEQREWQAAIEQFWNGDISEIMLDERLQTIRLQRLQQQMNGGLDYLTVGDFTYYDRMLDMATMFHIIPARFASFKGTARARYYAMARGAEHAAACDKKRWFDTNYHYIVPEYDGQTLSLQHTNIVDEFIEAKQQLGIIAKPTLIGPFTFVQLTKSVSAKQKVLLIVQLLPLYAQLLNELTAAGADWIVLEEPSLTQAISLEDMQLVEVMYAELREQAPEAKLFLQTYFEAVAHYERIVDLPVDGIGLDFVDGYKDNMAALRKHGFPQDKALGVGIINGRSVWTQNLAEAASTVTAVQSLAHVQQLWLTSACSLQHVPITKQIERAIMSPLYEHLAFANEKIRELAQLTYFFKKGEWLTKGIVAQSMQVIEQLAAHPSRQQYALHYTIEALKPTHFMRDPSVEQRAQLLKQQCVTEAIVQRVTMCGDLVERFVKHVDGIAATANGWVVMCGTTCTKPPIMYGDLVWRPVTMDALTEKQEKAVITGPMTILNSSFVRQDIALEEVALQVGYAIRQQVQTLEQAGTRAVQVVECAFMQGMPLREQKQAQYTRWATDAFCLAAAGLHVTKQIEVVVHEDAAEIFMKALDINCFVTETTPMK